MSEIRIDDFKLINLLREIEDITDINGCFFINIENNAVIESTISFEMPETILWEISVLIDTFRQFSLGVDHGELNDLMLEGEKGYVLLYFIPPHLILMALGADDINLSYVQLAMIDILNRMRKKLLEIGDKILKVPPKTKVELAIESKKMPTLVTAISTQRPIESISSEPKTISTSIKTEESPFPSEPATISASPEAISTPLKIVGEDNILEMIESISNKNQKEKYLVLKTIFESLKQELKSITGTRFAELLDILKDEILNNFGTSLALFDISKAFREVIKISDKFNDEDIIKYQNRIDNWINRIVKI